MSKQLEALLERYSKVDGWKARLCLSLGRSEATIDRWIRDGVPSADIAFDLALACGVKDREALAVASEYLLERAQKRSA